MEKYVGVWIDHEKAHIVSIIGDRETLTSIVSHYEGRFRLSGGSRSSTPYGPQEKSSEIKAEERRRHQLHDYYHKVIQAIRDAKGILIIGPGEAKVELEKEIKKMKALSSRIIGVETSDKLTKNQLRVKVKKFFNHYRHL